MRPPRRSDPRSARRPALLAAVALPLLLATAACGSDDPGSPIGSHGAGGASTATTTAAPAGAAEVTIDTFQFAPDPIVVDAGTTIRFTNDDRIDHTVTAGTREAPTPEVFDESLPQQGATAEVTLDEAGTYPYFCRIHTGPGMTGEIEVR